MGALLEALFETLLHYPLLTVKIKTDLNPFFRRT
jgi:hypothetical protein